MPARQRTFAALSHVAVRTRNRTGNPNMILLSLSIDDATLGQVIRRQFHSNLVAWNDPDEVLSHSSSHMCHHFTSGFQLDPKPRVGQCLCDSTFDFEGLFFFSQNLTSNTKMLSRVKPSPATEKHRCSRETGSEAPIWQLPSPS